MKRKFILGMFGIVFCFAGQASSQSSGTTATVGPPSSIVGRYLVYDSGAVTTFYRRQLPFGTTQTIERYEYSPSGNQGATALVSYDRRNGTIVVEQLMSSEDVAAFQRMNRVYRTCAGDIFYPPARYRIERGGRSSAIASSGNVWNVRQDTYTCYITNLRHDASDYSCRSSCVERKTRTDPALENMRMYSNREQALAEARRRSMTR